MRHFIPSMTYSEIENAINQKIIGKNALRDRIILRKRLLDGMTFEKIAEEMDMSTRQIYNIIYKYETKIFK